MCEIDIGNLKYTSVSYYAIIGLGQQVPSDIQDASKYLCQF